MINYKDWVLNARFFAMLLGLVAVAGCEKSTDPPIADVPSQAVNSTDDLPADDPEVVRSVERMLNTDAKESQKWAESHQPDWAPGIKRIYETGVKRIVIVERDEDLVGVVPFALIVDRGTIEWKEVHSRISELLQEQKIRETGMTTTSQYTVVYLR